MRYCLLLLFLCSIFSLDAQSRRKKKNTNHYLAIGLAMQNRPYQFNQSIEFSDSLFVIVDFNRRNRMNLGLSYRKLKDNGNFLEIGLDGLYNIKTQNNSIVRFKENTQTVSEFIRGYSYSVFGMETRVEFGKEFVSETKLSFALS